MTNSDQYERSLCDLYERIKTLTEKNAEALVQERAIEVQSWRCWCVTPSPTESDRIARSDLTAIVSVLGTPEELERAEKLFKYKYPKG